MHRKGHELLDSDSFRISAVQTLIKPADRVRSTLRTAARAENPAEHLDRFRQRVADLKRRVDEAQADRPPEMHQGLSYCWSDDVCLEASELPSPIRFAFLDVLYDYGASLNPDFFDHPDYGCDGLPAMVDAMKDGDLELFEYLCRRGYPFGEPFDSAGNPLLGFAITSSKLSLKPELIDWIGRLVAAGDPIDGYDGTLVPPLLRAVETNDAPAVAALLEHGADGYLPNEELERATDRAIDEDCPEALQALIEHGVDPRKGLVYFDDGQKTVEDRMAARPPVSTAILHVLAALRRGEIAENAKQAVFSRRAIHRPGGL